MRGFAAALGASNLLMTPPRIVLRALTRGVYEESYIIRPTGKRSVSLVAPRVTSGVKLLLALFAPNLGSNSANRQ